MLTLNRTPNDRTEQLVHVTCLWLVDRLHRLGAEVPPIASRPLVILLGGEHPDEPDKRALFREDADDGGASLDIPCAGARGGVLLAPDLPLQGAAVAARRTPDSNELNPKSISTWLGVVQTIVDNTAAGPPSRKADAGALEPRAMDAPSTR